MAIVSMKFPVGNDLWVGVCFEGGDLPEGAACDRAASRDQDGSQCAGGLVCAGSDASGTPTAAVAARRNSFEERAIAPPVAHASTPTSIPKTTAMHAFQRKNTATQLPLIVAVLINAVSLGRFAFEKVTVRRKRRKEIESNLGKNAAIQGNVQTATLCRQQRSVLKIQIVPTNSFAPLMRAIKSPHVRRAHNVPARTNRRSFNGLLRVTSAKRTASVPNCRKEPVKAGVCKPPVMPWMGPTSDLGDPNPWVDQPQFATEPAAQVPPECGEHTAFDPLHQRCRPVVGPRATCSSGPFATEHPWAQGTNPKRYVAVGGTGDGSSPDQAAPDATTALQGIDRQTNVTLLYGEGTFEEGLQLSGSGRVISLIGLCPERSHLSGGDQMAVHVEDVARLRVAGLHLSTSAPRSAEDSFREGALAVFGAGGIELSELFIESRYSLGITIYDVGERSVHLSNSRFGRTTVNSFAVITSAGSVSVRGSDFRGPNWVPSSTSLESQDVAVTYNYVGASASWGIVTGYVSGETEISHNEVAGPLGERGLYWYGDVQHTSPVNIRHNRFDQVGGTAILVIGGAGALDVAFNHIVGPIAQTSLLIGNRRSEETQRIYRNTIGWVGHSAIGLHSLRAPTVVEGNRIDGPVGSFGILGLETQQTPRLDIVRNRVGQTGENAIQVTNVRNDVTIFPNNIVGPTGARGIFVYNEEPPEPAEEHFRPSSSLPTRWVMSAMGTGSSWLKSPTRSPLKTTISKALSRKGISLISALGGGKVTNNEVGRAYEHGLYLGPSGNHPDRSPGDRGKFKTIAF